MIMAYLKIIWQVTFHTHARIVPIQPIVESAENSKKVIHLKTSNNEPIVENIWALFLCVDKSFQIQAHGIIFSPK